MMNNDQHLDRLSAYLDGELPSDERAELERDLLQDPALQRELALARSVRSAVRNRTSVLRTQIPVDLERSIRMQLGNEVERATAPAPLSWWSVLVNAIRRPMVAIPTGIAAVALLVMFMTDRSVPPEVARTSAKVDLYEASYANFSKVVKGEIALVKETSDTAALREFFAAEGVEYDVFFPEIAAELKGGVVSDHDGAHYAHLVYGAGEHLVYIFEVDEGSIERNIVAMRSEVAQDIEESRWHWEERSGVGTMFVWESNNIVCSAVSDLRTQDLSALFTLEKL
jgi:hypothetical protein